MKIVGMGLDEKIRKQFDNHAQLLGQHVEWIESAAHFGEHDVKDKPGEPLQPGQSANLIIYLTSTHPSLIIVDLDHAEIPWKRWIALIKASPATRRLPILAITANKTKGSHAQSIGADNILLHCSSDMISPTLLSGLIRCDMSTEIATACQDPLSDLALAGIALFNQQQFYEAHHGLEAAWNADQSAAKEIYRAILQVAVAYLQIERANYRGAVKMFLRVRQWLTPLPAQCRGVDIAQLQKDVLAAHHHLTTVGADQITTFDRAFFKPIHLVKNDR